MNKIALITGASRGIGAATAQLLAQKAYTVIINYHHSHQAANALVKEIQEKGGKARAFKADLANEADILQLFTHIDQEFGPLDVLINNAGINGGLMPVENINLATLEKVFATNVFGTFLASREAIKRMKQKKEMGGNIVNISSEAARFGGTTISAYAASKAAINTLTIALAREVAPYHIRVNCVSPGVIDTALHADSTPERIANLIKTLPMKRLGKVEEVAALIYWLISDAASYVNGSIIPITGAR